MTPDPLKSGGDAEHHPNLAVVAAGVGRAGVGVGVGMAEHDERVQFAHDADGRAGAAALQYALEPGYADAVLVGYVHGLEVFGHQLGRLELAEAGFRVVEYGLGDADEFIAAPVDFGLRPGLEFVRGRHGGSWNVVGSLCRRDGGILAKRRARRQMPGYWGSQDGSWR